MIARLDGNPLGQALATVSAVLGFVLVLLALVWSLPPSGSDDVDGDDAVGLNADVPELEPPTPLEQFAVITDRPVFNESRLPEVFDGDASEGGAEGDAAADALADVDAPDVTLTGVVITPTMRIVTLKPKDASESLITAEGSPLEGAYGSWQVSAIEPRSVVLRSGSGEEARFDLQLHDQVIAEPPKPAPPQQQTESSPDEQGDQPMSRAEEIRQRIAERREELRRAAEENGQASSEQPKKPNYQEAIQQMIQGRRTNASDEDEQE